MPEEYSNGHHLDIKRQKRNMSSDINITNDKGDLLSENFGSKKGIKRRRD